MRSKARTFTTWGPPPRTRPRVLLVNDDRPIRESRAAAIMGLGCEADITTNLAEARLCWAPTLYDLVVIDLHKHCDDGVQFCQEIKRSNVHERVALCCRPDALSASACPDYVVALEESIRDFAGNIQRILGSWRRPARRSVRLAGGLSSPLLQSYASHQGIANDLRAAKRV